MTYTINATIETVDYGTMKNTETFKDFTETINRYNEIIREIRERENNGEIKTWNVVII